MQTRLLGTGVLTGSFGACFLFLGTMSCESPSGLQRHPDTPNESELISVEGEEAELLSAYFPGVAFRVHIKIPDEMLPIEDVEQGNLGVVMLLDGELDTVGYLRTIFTPVACSAGVCEGIRFSLAHDDTVKAFDSFNPPGTAYPFKKYIGEEYLYFSEDDFQTLRGLVRDPPDVLRELSAETDLVDGVYATSPTRTQFREWVVPGAAFTSFAVMQYAITTENILANMETAGLLMVSGS